MRKIYEQVKRGFYLLFLTVKYKKRSSKSKVGDKPPSKSKP